MSLVLGGVLRVKSMALVLSADQAADAATPNLWKLLLPQGGFREYGSRWIKPGDPGYLKPAWLQKFGRWGVFVNGPDGRGRPLDAPQFAVEFLGLSWAEAIQRVLDLARSISAQNLVTGQTGGLGHPVKSSQPLPSGLTQADPAVRAAAKNMRDAGMPVDVALLEVRIRELEDPALGPDTASKLALLKNIRAAVGGEHRIHPEWEPWATRSGRWRVKPGLFELPKEMRTIFQAPTGRTFLCGDIRAANLVSAAVLSGSPSLHSLCDHPDPLAALGARLLGVPAEEIAGDLRAVLKKFAHTALCGGSPIGLRGATSSLGEERQGRVLKGWGTIRSELWPWYKELLRRKAGSVPLTFPVFVKHALEPAGDSYGQLAAMHAQGFVAAHVDASIIDLQVLLGRRSLKSSVVAMLHDSILVECDQRYVGEAESLLKSVLEQPMSFGGWKFHFTVRITRSTVWDG
jgi:hypothetical protein